MLTNLNTDVVTKIATDLSYKDKLSFFSATQQLKNMGDAHFSQLCIEQFGVKPKLNAVKLVYHLIKQVEKI